MPTVSQAREAVKVLREYTNRPGRAETCGECEHMNLEAEICTLFNTRPPLRVVCNAQVECSSFDLKIPF